MKFEFNRDTHTYLVDGVEVPHITGIVPAPDFFCSPERLEETRVEGEEDHSLIKMYWDTRYAGNDKLKALERWTADNAGILGELVEYETPRYSDRHRFAGTPDALFSKAVVDFKRQPGNSRRHALQLAAQHILGVENGIIGKTKVWLIAWYDGTEWKARNVFNPQAEGMFIELVRRYYIDREFERYLKSA